MPEYDIGFGPLRGPGDGGVVPQLDNSLAIPNLILGVTYVKDPRSGIQTATVTATWDAPPLGEDLGKTTKNKVVEYWISDRQGTAFIPDETWSAERKVNTRTATFRGLILNTILSFRVRAKTGGGQYGPYATAQINTAVDTTPPPKPSTPTLIGTLRGAAVRWDGGFVDDTGGAVPSPSDLAFVKVQLSLSPTMSSPFDGGTLSTAGQTPVTPAGATGAFNIYARLQAWDKSGNVSVWSDVGSTSSIQLIPADIGGGAVTSAKLADAAVTASKLLDGAVVNSKLDGLAVTVDKIADNAVIARTILAGQVISEKIAANAVVADKINALAVTSEKINAGAVVSGKVATNSLTALEIASGAITADELDAYAVTAKVITGGTYRTGTSGEDRIEIIDEVVYDAYLGYNRSIRDTIRWIRGYDGALVGEIRGFMGDIGAYGIHLNASVEIGNVNSVIYQVGRRSVNVGATQVRMGSATAFCDGAGNWTASIPNLPGTPTVVVAVMGTDSGTNLYAGFAVTGWTAGSVSGRARYLTGLGTATTNVANPGSGTSFPIRYYAECAA